MFSKKDKKRFLEILRNKNYHVAKACREFKISRDTFYRWNKKKWFAQAIEDMKEEDIDDAEETLRLSRKGIPRTSKGKDGKVRIIGWILKPDTTANIFFLKTKGRERGYIEKVEHDGTLVVQLHEGDDEL